MRQARSSTLLAALFPRNVGISPSLRCHTSENSSSPHGYRREYLKSIVNYHDILECGAVQFGSLYSRFPRTFVPM